MPALVPVFDPEVPKFEQDPNSDKLIKHRKWDTPHVVFPTNKSDDKHDKHSTRKYFRDKYNDNNNRDNKRDERFYRKPVYDEFDYMPPKKKKLLKQAMKPPKNDSDDKKVVKTIKKERVKHEYH